MNDCQKWLLHEDKREENIWQNTVSWLLPKTPIRIATRKRVLNKSKGFSLVIIHSSDLRPTYNYYISQGKSLSPEPLLSYLFSVLHIELDGLLDKKKVIFLWIQWNYLHLRGLCIITNYCNAYSCSIKHNDKWVPGSNHRSEKYVPFKFQVWYPLYFC